jgi:hypothetical protein
MLERESHALTRDHLSSLIEAQQAEPSHQRTHGNALRRSAHGAIQGPIRKRVMTTMIATCIIPCAALDAFVWQAHGGL